MGSLTASWPMVLWPILALAVALAASIVLPTTASAATVGPRLPGTGADVTGAGTVSWTAPGNVTADDTSYSTALLNSSGAAQSHYLRATGYGFTLPTDAIIDGITVTINRAATLTGSGHRIRDAVVSLLKGGSVTGGNLGATGTNWPTSMSAQTYGGAANLWGGTWSAADINSPTFGVELSALTDTAANNTASVDYLSI
ncbi:MAG TPA: hypothetical protein VIK32_04235, partial [Candidatus Limnocylindrales bacterium]